MTISVPSNGRKLSLLDGGVVRPGFEDAAREKEFSRQFLIPLLARVRWLDDKNPPLSLRSLLRPYETSLDRFAKANFVSEQGAF